MPWKHGKAGASPAVATISMTTQTNTQAAPAIGAGLPWVGGEKSLDRKPRSLDPGLISLVARSITGACHQF